MKVTFFELQRFKVERVDWNRVISDLARAHVSSRAIAAALGVDCKTILGFKNDGRRPRYEEAQALLAMHQHYCRNPMSTG